MVDKIEKIPRSFKNVDWLLGKLKREQEYFWVRRGEKRVLSLFRQMAIRVPAYKDFLKKNKLKPDKIKSIKDFKYIPPIDKKNYLRAYPVESLCWDGKFDEKRWTISTNSGSTGEPFYFPREIEQDWQYAILAELYLLNNFQINKKSTLYLDCFAMGAWIGGLFTYEAIRLLAESGKYKLTIFTPGIFKDEIYKALRNLGPKFDQVIIGGYPPFVKDIVDDGMKLGIKWKKYNLGFIFSAEGFTEEFRDYIYRKSGVKNYFTASLNHYGTADMGTMAHETPVTILIRKLVNANPKLTSSIFPEMNRLPTLAQFLPELFYFEEENNVLYCSAYSGLPFVRYDLKDYGGILGFGEVLDKLSVSGLNLDSKIRENAINYWRLPFVYLYERSDFVVKLYGANIFPETIRRALSDKSFEQYLTGKFAMIVRYGKAQNQYLEINIELKRGCTISKKIKDRISTFLVNRLLEENSEYSSNYKSDPNRQKPKLIFHQYGNPVFFKPGAKQKWVLK